MPGRTSSKNKPLSEKQRAILNFMQSYIAQNSFPPTIRDICIATGIKSTSVVNYNLNKLVNAGLLSRSSRKSRGLRLTPKAGGMPPREVASIPVIGMIGASQPIPMPDDVADHVDPENMISVMPMLLRGVDPAEVFALKVKGDSMIDAMIREGDIVLFRRQDTARDGEMVAIWLAERGETTLKYFYNEGERVRLQPAHPTMQPIYVSAAQCHVQGRVLSVIRPTV
jgi:repressor LexA